jgi:hypothetical protein
MKENNYTNEMKKSRYRYLVIFLSLLIGALLMYLGSFNKPDSFTSILFLTFGTTFCASAIIGTIMIVAGFADLKENAIELSETFGRKLGMHCADRFKLVQSASTVGLTNVYKTRTEALEIENFYPYLKQENDTIFILGSSLKGVLQDRHNKHIVTLLENKIKMNTEIIFMLTHPLFADFRAAQEHRNPKDIGLEIIKSLKIISKLKNANKENEELVSVYLYRGTPTSFGIRTSSRMLINAYPYGKQAYEAPCVEFNSESAGYNSYNATHFQTQIAGKIDNFDMKDESIKQLEHQLDDFSSLVHNFEKDFIKAD